MGTNKNGGKVKNSDVSTRTKYEQPFSLWGWKENGIRKGDVGDVSKIMITSYFLKWWLWLFCSLFHVIYKYFCI